MKEQIKHSELTFQAIVESTPNAIILVNKEGEIAYANSQSEKLFGYSRAELIGKLVERLIPERYHKNHPGFRNMFFSSPSVRAMGAGRELFALRKNGTEFPIEIGLNPIVTGDGTLVLASIIDITERKKGEERFRLVVESAPNAMILVNEQGIITLVNTQTEKLFGYNRNELVGNKLEILIPQRFSGHHPGHRNQFFESPSVRSMGTGRELFGLRKNGSEIPVEIGLNPIETADGQMVLASIIDITERKIQESIIKLEIKNKELEQFAYIASHDLQEPLRTVSNYIEILQEDYIQQLDKQALAYLHTIKLATQRMRILVKALLDYSRLGRDGKMEQVDCKKILNDVLSDIGNLIQTTNASIKYKGELPQLHGHEIGLRQVFQNLITNAIKFVKHGTLPEVLIDCKKTDDQWRFSITDNGVGIDPKNFERVFNIFQRLDTTQTNEGHGIGLANCKKIVELHGGKIWLDSHLGTGTTFHFTIPNLHL